MELYQLHTFAAVAELGSLTRASERLHLSQPAASAQIKTLEKEFGFPLFERKPSGLSLTRVGAALLPEIQKLLLTAADLTSQVKNLRGVVSGTIRFATTFDPAMTRIAEVMSLMLKRHPMLEIEVHQRSSRSVLSGVLSGEFDAGMALGNREITSLRRIILKELRYRIVAPGTWPSSTRQFSWEEIAARPWILAPKGGPHSQMAADLFAVQNIQPVKVIEADNEIIIASLITAGVGLGLMREDLALQSEAMGNVIVLDNGLTSTSLQVVFRASGENELAMAALLDVLQELWPKR